MHQQTGQVKDAPKCLAWKSTGLGASCTAICSLSACHETIDEENGLIPAKPSYPSQMSDAVIPLTVLVKCTVGFPGVPISSQTFLPYAWAAIPIAWVFQAQTWNFLKSPADNRGACG